MKIFNSSSKIEVNPIGYFYCQKKYPQDAAKQSSIDNNNELGEIRLLPGHHFEQALDDVDSFSHLWIIYHFHRNNHWKSKVLPPRFSEIKRGVFSTRSPYRPNGIGMSAVEIVRRTGLSLWIQKFDLLDGTPILDIKPYLAYADSVPHAHTGWMNYENQIFYEIIWSPESRKKLDWLKENGISELESFIQNQLENEPTNHRKKRVREIPDEDMLYSLDLSSTQTEQVSILSSEKKVTQFKTYELAYRTWRCQFKIESSELPSADISNKASFSSHLTTPLTSPLTGEPPRSLNESPHRLSKKNCVYIVNLRSGYSQDEVNLDEIDIYQDKRLHREFIKIFDKAP